MGWLDWWVGWVLARAPCGGVFLTELRDLVSEGITSRIRSKNKEADTPPGVFSRKPVRNRINIVDFSLFTR